MTEDKVPADEAIGNDQDKTGKFSQVEMDKIIKERVAREKEKYKTLEESFNSFKQEKEEEVSYYKSTMQKQVEVLIKDVPESVRKLVEKLPLKEQLEYLSDQNNLVFDKKLVPETPKPKADAKPRTDYSFLDKIARKN